MKKTYQQPNLIRCLFNLIEFFVPTIDHNQFSPILTVIEES